MLNVRKCTLFIWLSVKLRNLHTILVRSLIEFFLMKEVEGTPADKEELRQRLENSGEDWGTPGKTAKLRGSLGISSDSRSPKGNITKASRRDSKGGTTVGRLGEL